MNLCAKCKRSIDFFSDEQEFYRSIDVPTPTLCYRCCWQRQMAFRNDIYLYKRTCDFSGKELISHYGPNCFCPIYDREMWYSDQWDAFEYGQEIDYSKSFFEQFHALQKRVPRPHKISFGETENSEFTNTATRVKNCYMVFSVGDSENCYYSKGMAYSTDCVDCANLLRCEKCYEATNASDSYNCFYSFDFKKCADSLFLMSCVDCTNCFGCINLFHKQYCWFNEQLSKDEYEQRLADAQLGDFAKREEMKRRVHEFFLQNPRKCNSNISCEDCIGDFIFRSKDAKNCVQVYDSEHIRSSCHASGKDCVRITSADNQERCYEVGLCSDWPNTMFGNKFCVNIFGKSSNLEYCDYCCACDDCFGCVGLNKKRFCIFNKQYTEDEYHKQIAILKEHMRETGEYGEFFPAYCSPFGYNETYAQDFFLLSKDEAMRQGFQWNDVPSGAYHKETLALNDVADHIRDVNDSICQKILPCASCGRNYKIIQQEFEFYKKHDIPIPRLCFYCRYATRASLQSVTEFYHRQCMCEKGDHDHAGRCAVEFETTYTPDRQEIVYCESCYQKEFI